MIKKPRSSTFLGAALLPAVITVVALLAVPQTPQAQEGCAAVQSRPAELDPLFEALQGAETEAVAQSLNTQLWQFWTTAPDQRAQEMLDRGMRRRSGYDFLGALSDFDALIAYCPTYAEGWNQRAFVHFLTEDHAAALADLDQALALSPRHLGALSGQALTYLRLNRLEEARAVLSDALTLNPWLPERHLMAPGGPLAAPGLDL